MRRVGWSAEADLTVHRLGEALGRSVDPERVYAGGVGQLGRRQVAARRSGSNFNREGYVLLTYLFLYLPVTFLVFFSFSTAAVGVFSPPGYTLHWYRDVLNDLWLMNSVRAPPGTYAIIRYRFPGRGLLRQALIVRRQNPLRAPEAVRMVETRVKREHAAHRSKDYSRYSFWLETSGDDLTPRPPLDGSITVDVAILGGGLTGLWTAYYLLRQQPSLKIAIVEKEIAGFGASGRNGGWCSARFSVSPSVLRERVGRDAARAVYLTMCDAVDEVGQVLAREGIDAHFEKGGWLTVARGPHYVPSLLNIQAAFEALGMGDRYQMLDAAQTAARVRIAGAVAGLYNPDCAVVHPGRLVRGLARVVERRGATIYEQTEATDFVGGREPRLVTARGDVRATTIVLAGEAYLSRLRRLHRQVIPIYTQIVLTEPLTPSQWAEIGWGRRECMHSCRLFVDYLSKTADGRIAFGGRGAPYPFGSRIEDAYDVYPPTAQMIRATAIEWFPVLKGIQFSHVWGGPIGVSRDWMPTFAYDPASGVATARAYGGQGVSTTNLAGRVLADLITQTDSALTHLPMVGHRSRSWEPEPLRWLAMRFVQEGYRRLDRTAERTGKAPAGRSLAERLSRH